MAISYDSAKRQWTLRERGLDFAEAEEVFAGPTFDQEDDRHDYGETRLVTVGFYGAAWLCWSGRRAAMFAISFQ